MTILINNLVFYTFPTFTFSLSVHFFYSSTQRTITTDFIFSHFFFLSSCHAGAPRVRNREEKIVYVDVVNFRGSLTLEMVAYPQPHVKSMAIYGADVNDTVGGLLEDRINVTCAATTVAPALLTCNIAVVNVTDGDVYQIVFSNHLGDLTFNFTGRHVGEYKTG